jgi:gamma-glutamyl:cysteine ligase YbdK (ATP-grasp superfamily)
MGLEIDRERFAQEDFERFEARLERCLAVLESMLAQPSFGEGTPSIGAELEVALIDEASRPLPLNEEVLRETVDERMTLELDRFNLECNLLHTELAGRPFSHLRAELESARAELRQAAAVHGGRIAMIGILPTLVEAELQSDAMTDAIRYRALSRALRSRRGGPFLLDIDGQDPLKLACEDVTFEGAATSFQIHLRVAPGSFSDVFDAAQLATAPMLAAAANSPTFLGHRLWDETRVALFKQAVDHREARAASGKARVAFGERWLSEGPIELFRQAVRDHSTLLPVVYDEDPESSWASGRVPGLKEIRLHQGTVWSWNRPVYDPHDGGHVRIELRALPSGPTVEDMLANAAFFIGLCLGLAPRMAEIREQLDFDFAHRNFYRAAQSGLTAPLAWPVPGGGVRAIPARHLLPELADVARAGLADARIDSAESDPLVARIVERAERGQTGAAWQRARLGSLESSRPTREALVRMLEEYVARSDEGAPVDQWELT